MKIPVLFLCFLLLFSCQNNQEPQKEVLPDSVPGTPTPKKVAKIDMVDLLKNIHKHSNPQDNYHMNSQRAAALQPGYEQATQVQQKFPIGFKYLQELLYAGKNETVIQEAHNMLNMVGGYETALNPQSKPFYEMLGLAHMRQGEQKNCIENHTSASCIIPLKKEGLHKYPEGSKNAIKVYSKILSSFPDDYQTKWLLNIAYMTIGSYPREVPDQWRIPSKAFEKSNTRMQPFKDVAIPLGLDVTGLSGGCNIEDFNNDGFLDIFATSYGLDHQARLFINQGDGSFSDETESAQLKGIVSGLNTIHADYNNDGLQDILILRGGWLGLGGSHPNSLLKNNGDPDGTGITFTDVTQDAGLLTMHPTQTSAWADINNDGWLDLFVGNETTQQVTHASELFISNGDGTFTEKAEEYGVNLSAFVKGVTWGDVNNDRFPDLYISVLGGKNKLFLNQAGKAFQEIGERAGVSEPYYSFPTWFWDYDNDGDEDIFVAGYDLKRLKLVAHDAGMEYYGFSPQAETPRLFQNNGDPNGTGVTFTDVTKEMGLNKVMYAMGCNFGDLDNDGYLDFYIGTGSTDFRSIVPNRMFKNDGGKAFTEVTMDGFGHIQKGHGVGFGDLDNDGDQDIYCVMGGGLEADLAQNILFENHNQSNDWITVELEGKKMNRDALGSKIEVIVEGTDGKQKTIYQTVGTGATFGASSLQQEIGLGKVKSIQSLIVHWASPDIAPSEFKNVKKNTFLKITEGETELGYLDRKKTPFQKSHKGHQHH